MVEEANIWTSFFNPFKPIHFGFLLLLFISAFWRLFNIYVPLWDLETCSNYAFVAIELVIPGHILYHIYIWAYIQYSIIFCKWISVVMTFMRSIKNNNNPRKEAGIFFPSLSVRLVLIQMKKKENFFFWYDFPLIMCVSIYFWALLLHTDNDDDGSWIIIMIMPISIPMEEFMFGRAWNMLLIFKNSIWNNVILIIMRRKVRESRRVAHRFQAACRHWL